MVATMMNAVAMPRSNTNRRNNKPAITAIAHVATHDLRVNGSRHVRSPIHEMPRAIRNGAATPSTPESAVPSSWLRRPMATNITTATTSTIAAVITAR